MGAGIQRRVRLSVPPAVGSTQPSSGTPMTLVTTVRHSYNPRRPVQHPQRGCAPDDKVSRSRPVTSGATVTYVVSCRPPKREVSCTSEGQLHAQTVSGPETEGRPWERPVWMPEGPKVPLTLRASPFRRQATSAVSSSTAGSRQTAWTRWDGRQVRPPVLGPRAALHGHRCVCSDKCSPESQHRMVP